MPKSHAPTLIALVNHYVRCCMRARVPPQVNGLARELGLTPVQLSRRFRRERGEYLSDHFKSLQITFAKHLLRKTDQPMRKIAARCLFSNVRSFNRAFQRLESRSPTKFREEMRRR